MRRRDLLALIATMVTPWSLNAEAETAKVVAFVLPAATVADMAGADPAFPPARAFVHALRDLGRVEGRNVVIEWRSAEGRPERASAIFAELESRGVDVVAIGASSFTVPESILLRADEVIE